MHIMSERYVASRRGTEQASDPRLLGHPRGYVLGQVDRVHDHWRIGGKDGEKTELWVQRYVTMRKKN